MVKKVFSTVLRISISFGLLGFLFWLMRDDIGQIGSILKRSDLNYIFLALVFFLINICFLAWRLKIIFHGENLELSLSGAIRLTYIGYFFNNFMPTAVGGDIMKAVYAAKLSDQKVKSYASVMMDRIIGLYSFLILAAIALAVDRGRFNVPGLRPIVFVFLTAGFAGFWVMTHRRVEMWMENSFSKFRLLNLGKKLHEVYKIIQDYRNRKDIIAKSILMSLFAQSIYFIIVYMFFVALGADVRIANVFLIMPVVTFISMIPSIGGLGVREGAIVAFFSVLVGKETAFAGSLLLMFGYFFASFLGGVIFLFWIISENKKTAKAAQDQ